MAGRNENTEYEKFVRDITEALLRAQGLETVKVQHDVQVRGTSRSHQVDVYWEYRLGGMLHRVIINCKRYSHTVEVTDVLTLSGVLSDMPGVRGLIVTTVGFQKGAVDYAKHHGIGLKVIRPPEEADWEGRIYSFRLAFQFAVPQLIGCKIRLDQEWIKSNAADGPESLAGTLNVDARRTVVRDLKTGVVSDMNELWNRAMRENRTETGDEGSGVLRWDEAQLETPGRPALRVKEIEFRWKFREAEPTEHEIRSDPAAIVRDAIAGTLLFVDPDGTVSGDVEEEFGAKRE